MERIRIPLVTAIAIGLLASSVTGVKAQSDETEWPQVERGIVVGDDDPSKQVIHAHRLEPREAPRPAVVIFHSGAFIGGSPDDDAGWVPFFTDQGYVTFLAGYRLFSQTDGSNPWPAQLDDAQHAVRWIRAHAADYDVDPDRICAVGHSSGGQLAGLVGTTEAADDTDPELTGISSRVACVVTLAGDNDLTVPYDFAQFTVLNEGIFGTTLDEHPEIYEAASPAHSVDELTVPFLVVHGTEDHYVPTEMSRALVAALEAADRDVTYLERPLSHMGVRADAEIWDAVEVFLADQLRYEAVVAEAEPTDDMTAESEPTTETEADDTNAPDLLPGADLEVEEVEPGVYRVLSDGLRDLSEQVRGVTVTADGE